MRGATSILIIAAALGGCEVGPDFAKPEAPSVEGYTKEALPAATSSVDVPGGAAQRFVSDMDIPGQCTEASLRGQIAATQQVIDIDTQTVEIFRRQYALGQVAGADELAQEAALAQAQATLPPLQKALAQQRDLLTALTGALPSDEPAEAFELSSLQLPPDVPVTLPSKLIEQRPDIRSAEQQLHSASAQVGVATANLLPNVMLSGNLGNAANDVDRLFTTGTSFWTLAAGLTQPLFDGGTLLHRKRAAEDTFDQAAAQYRSTVITAFQNVADSLRALQYDADASTAAENAERAAQASLDIARRQLQLGAISYLALLTADLSAGFPEPRSGAGRSLLGYRRPVPIAGRRLVEPHRCRRCAHEGRRMRICIGKKRRGRRLRGRSGGLWRERVVNKVPGGSYRHVTTRRWKDAEIFIVCSGGIGGSGDAETGRLCPAVRRSVAAARDQ